LLKLGYTKITLTKIPTARSEFLFTSRHSRGYNSRVYKNLLLKTFIAVLILGITHMIGSMFYLYWSTWWFDNISHFLGGFASAFIVFWILSITILKSQLSLRGTIFILIPLVLAVGLGWEVFEYAFNISDPTTGETYITDTSLDLVADTLGAIVAAFFIGGNKKYV
jgi:uncharacterized membrane protein YjdF